MQLTASELKDLRKQGAVRVFWLGVCFVLSATSLLYIFAYAGNSSNSASIVGAPPHSILEPQFTEPFMSDDDDHMVDFLIYMKARANLDALNLPGGKVARRNIVINSLKNAAAQSQNQILNELELLTTQGVVSSYRILWIANAIQVTGRASLLLTLSDFPGVERVVLDKPILFLDDDNHTAGLPPSGLTWGLERIRARHVWEGLGITGSGVTVAILDSGVDWLHPDLNENYRGYAGSSAPVHVGNWFDAIDGTGTPFDPRGHGTHVAGTAVGMNGIGVAPGAQWMAVRVLDANGFGTVGNIHAGFQWLLAPDGDPALSPEVVNNSWGSKSNIPDFLPDVIALQSAGIIPVFAAGNSGPEDGTIHSPASYPDTISVGASDDIDAIAWFSSRGPSGFTNEPKPAFVAPGTRVLSAMPGGGYSYRDGTSMAAPHATGLFALMLSANNTLNESQITAILTSTAKAVDDVVPSNKSGWGRIDAFAAVSSELPVGVLKGRVTDGIGQVVEVIIQITTPSGSVLEFTSDSSGYYEIPLQPAIYKIGVEEFGFESFEFGQVAVTAHQVTFLNIQLTARPKGTLSGFVLEINSGFPLTAAIRVVGTPAAVTSNGQGEYQIVLPEGSYTLEASAIGHHFGKANVIVTRNSTVTQDFTLRTAPRTLLVDSGQWYYRSQISFFSETLEQLELAYDIVTVRDPLIDIPDADELVNYDVVIWSSPTDSPSQISAGEVISSYLSQGGNLIISGQNIAEYEDLLLGSKSWWHHHLEADYIGKLIPPIKVAAHAESVFHPITFTLNEPGSAGNQSTVDRVAIHPNGFSQPAFRYQDDSLAGLQAGDCAPFEVVYLGFGLEGISSVGQRTDIISRSLSYFTQPEHEIGIRIEPDVVNDIVVSGHRLTMTFDVANLSELFTDTFTFNVEENSWPATVFTETLTLGSCHSERITIAIDVPSNLEPDTIEEFEIAVYSSNDSEYEVHVPVHLKSTGRILLVDDDRWYDSEDSYISALESNGFIHDYWEIGSSPIIRGSPPSFLLNEYDFVIWYTGYDWFAPITGDELKSLQSYLDQGGRLFLSSQDYLDKHGNDILTSDYFGVHSFRESVTPTLAFGYKSPAFLDVLTRPLHLDFGPYQNFSDGLIANKDSQASFWHDGGYVAGLVNAGTGWRGVFWATPFEAVPADKQSAIMNRIVGWLSDLGGSTFDADARVVPMDVEDGPLMTFTLTVRAFDGSNSSGVWITNTIPTKLTIDPDSISGGALYDPATRDLTWHGVISGGEEHVIRYQVNVDPGTPAGTLIENKVNIYYDRHELRFERSSPIWVGTADLSGSTFDVDHQVADIGSIITYHLEIINSAAHSEQVTATVFIPYDLSLITETITASEGIIYSEGNRFIWSGTAENHHVVTVTYAVSIPLTATKLKLPTPVVLSDGISDLLLLHQYVELAPPLSYLPIIAAYH